MPSASRRGEAAAEVPPWQAATAVLPCSSALLPAQQPIQAAVTVRSHRPSRLRRREREVERVRLMRMREGEWDRWRRVRAMHGRVRGAVVALDRFPSCIKRTRVSGSVTTGDDPGLLVLDGERVPVVCFERLFQFLQAMQSVSLTQPSARSEATHVLDPLDCVR